MLKIIKCKELPQWIISSDKAAYHPWSNTIYLTKWRYLPHELVHWFAVQFHLPWLHQWIDRPKRTQDAHQYRCPFCGAPMHAAECCAQDDEWLFVCDVCRETFTLEEIYELRD